MLTPQNTGLIVVDIQGKLARFVHNSEEIIANCGKLITACQILGLPIVLLEQNPDKLGHTVPELKALLGETEPITKYTFNACDCSEFSERLTELDVDTWLVCGLEAHICVYQTAVGLVEQGYEVELVSDCISSRKKSNIDLSIRRTSEKGISITGLEMCLYDLISDCRTNEFKQILSLIR
ncbi:isochorismatase [Vibrio galatheae]|uniref:Isochorismatase n=1 Tax=Vibrio galatheae TaxID=579748 RepID=A0A0F4NGY4_9VIBR|nr:hydrolase [Vibrio galatheae]KJY82382.1 isochorismatase [Vibrio galatheae]